MSKITLKLDESNDLNSGIYQIVNKQTCQFYIGSTVNLQRRRHNHFHLLRIGKHDNVYLQRSFDKYGLSKFDFFVIEYSILSHLLTTEQKYLDVCWDNCNKCFNIGKIADAPARGTKRSEECKRKMSLDRKGKIPNRIYCVSEETKAKLRKALKNNKNHLGKKHSENAKLKISISSKGKTRKSLSKETKMKIGLANKGKIRTAETKEKLKFAALNRRKEISNVEQNISSS